MDSPPPANPRDVIRVGFSGTATLNIRGFTIQNGRRVGLRYLNGSSGLVTQNIITGNHMEGIRNEGSSPIIEDNEISYNWYDGIHNLNSSPTTMGNTITGNSNSGIQNRNGSAPTISSNTITGNTPGIFNIINSDPLITTNTITGNSWGIWNDMSNPTITKNVISFNGGYGIYNSFTSAPPITNNIITGNDMGIYNYFDAAPTIIHNTIIGNVFYGIYNDSNVSTITNNIISSNGNYGIYAGFIPAVCTYNDVWGHTLGNYSGALSDQTGINGNISLTPQFDGTYHLSPSSPCIDAGTNAGVYTDMDGDTRPQGNGFDIGADEYPHVFVNPVASFKPVVIHHLGEVNTLLECITENLGDDIPNEIQELLDEIQEHINNANTTNNTIYANNELLKALEICRDIQEMLGITCPF